MDLILRNARVRGHDRNVDIAVNDGVAAADEAMARVQAPIWASEDLKAGLASFRKNGPGLAKFAGR